MLLLAARFQLAEIEKLTPKLLDFEEVVHKCHDMLRNDELFA